MKRVGIIGGMSWESTRLYYETINRAVASRLGGLHSADLLIASPDFAPIAEMQASGRWDEAGVLLGEIAANLEAAGADAIALATNTMHKCADAIRTRVKAPLLHIADALGNALESDDRHQPLLLGTRFTMEDDFLRSILRARGLKVSIPNLEDRDFVHLSIFKELCRGLVRERTRARFLEIVEAGARAGVDSVILGCTEISMLIAPGGARLPDYDTAQLHAMAIVDFMLGAETR